MFTKILAKLFPEDTNTIFEGINYNPKEQFISIAKEIRAAESIFNNINGSDKANYDIIDANIYQIKRLTSLLVNAKNDAGKESTN